MKEFVENKGLIELIDELAKKNADTFSLLVEGDKPGLILVTRDKRCVELKQIIDDFLDEEE